jgi:hypothetical protein
VKPRGEGFVGICKDDDGPECEVIPLTAGDVEVLEVNSARLGRAIAGALNCEAKDRLILDGTRQIASLGSAPLPILLTVQSDEASFSAVVAQLVAKLPKGFVLFSPTSRFCSASATEMMGRVNAGFFTLESHIELLDNGRLHSARTGAELFAKHLPEQRETVKKSEALQIFAVLQKLRSKRAGVSAPLYDVFVATVLEGRSQRAAAKQCDCSPAQMSKRVRELVAEFGMPLKQLQNYGKELVDMQTSVKGDRRRKRRPGSGPGSFADDNPDKDNEDSAPAEEYRYEEGSLGG